MRRENRLTSPAEFQTVYRSGMRLRTGSVIVIASSETVTTTKVGFAASKRVGSAVARNRAKRRLRAAATPLVPATRPRLLVLQATSQTSSEPWQNLEADVRRGLVSVGALDA